jgi:mannose-6-phosphate isomerase-like protein (cupin superfamily)
MHDYSAHLARLCRPLAAPGYTSGTEPSAHPYLPRPSNYYKGTFRNHNEATTDPASKAPELDQPVKKALGCNPHENLSNMSIPRVNEPLGRPAPYIVPPYCGESMSLPGTKSVVRILASAKETDELMSVFRLDGVAADPVGFHYHKFAHDIFLCIKGQVKVWFGDQCRLLLPGDFASVPPVSKHPSTYPGTFSIGLGPSMQRPF